MTATPELAKVRLDSLTGLRFLAALIVLGDHLNGNVTLAPWQHFNHLLGQGDTAVSFFFILSGFVLTWSHRPGTSARTFYRRRFARIYPAYLTALAIAFVLDKVRHAPIAHGAVLTPFLLQSWVPGSTPFAVNGVAWSLSDEAFFYALFPVLIPVVIRLTARSRWTGMAVAVIGIWFVALLGSVIGGTVGYWLHFVFPPARLLEFIIGMLLASLVRDHAVPTVPLPAGLAVAAVLYLAAGESSFGYLREVGVTLVGFIILIASAAKHDLHGHGGIWSSKLGQHLGAWSYSFYLLHQMILVTSVYMIGKTGRPAASVSSGDGVLIGLLVLSAATTAAWLMFTQLERPLERAISRSRRDPVSYGSP